jgi:hypothetical protein
MITPKEKAEELFDKYYQIFVDDIDEHFIDTSKRISKQCALIAVDEVIESLHEHHWQNRLIINYWEEVKHEIENYG